MGEVHDWRSVADPRAALRRAASALEAGRVVLLPTEVGAALTASALHPEAAARLRPEGDAAPLSLAVRSSDEVADWAPDLRPLARRLARRFWPGPLILSLSEGVDRGLAGRLPEEVRRLVCPQGVLHLRAPGHEATQELLHRLSGPLLLREAPEEGAAERADLALVDGPGPFPEGVSVVHVAGGAWRLERVGAISEELLRRNAACMIVFVCTGNTCRSPLAETLFKQRLAQRLGCAPQELPERGYVVLSAGLAASAGAPAADEALEVARAYGGDLSAHRSRPLTAQMAAQADYLIAMTHGHVRALAGCAPHLLNPAGDDVSDPIGCDRSVYEECARQIWDFLEPLAAEVAPPRGPSESSCVQPFLGRAGSVSDRWEKTPVAYAPGSPIRDRRALVAPARVIYNRWRGITKYFFRSRRCGPDVAGGRRRR
jgi:protein-tyrosine phosphatase